MSSKLAAIKDKFKKEAESAPPPKKEAVVEPNKDYDIRWHEFVGHWYVKYTGTETKWQKVPVHALKTRLERVHGISDESEPGHPSLADYVMDDAVANWSVAYAGNYAGYLEMGEYATSNGTLLITQGRKLLKAEEGDCRFLLNFLRRSFKRPQQFLAFCGWMQWAILSLHQPVGSWSHGQAMLIVGPTGSGKSTTQNDIIEPLLTNHHADAMLWLKGGSPFNEQLGEAEHWLMSDPKSATKKEQDEFMAGLKEAIANVWMPIHPKGQKQIDLPTFRRMTITLNREERALRIVSDLAQSEAEKILMLDFEDAGRYAPNGKGGLLYPDWKRKIDQQLPALKHWLMNKFSLPEGMLHPRFGVQYINPELLRQLSAPTQEEIDADLDSMIYDSCFQERTMMIGRGIQWVLVNRIELSASQIVDRLTGAQNPARERAKLFYETQNAKRMSELLGRSCKDGGQRNRYSIARRETKPGHNVYVLIKSMPKNVHNNSEDGEEPSNAATSLAEMVQRSRNQAGAHV
jgi:hypothetical protein